jgi:hypothetical protein
LHERATRTFLSNATGISTGAADTVVDLGIDLEILQEFDAGYAALMHIDLARWKREAIERSPVGVPAIGDFLRQSIRVDCFL